MWFEFTSDFKIAKVWINHRFYARQDRRATKTRNIPCHFFFDEKTLDHMYGTGARLELYVIPSQLLAYTWHDTNVHSSFYKYCFPFARDIEMPLFNRAPSFKFYVFDVCSGSLSFHGVVCVLTNRVHEQWTTSTFCVNCESLHKEVGYSQKTILSPAAVLCDMNEFSHCKADAEAIGNVLTWIDARHSPYCTHLRSQ